MRSIRKKTGHSKIARKIRYRETKAIQLNRYDVFIVSP